MRIGRGMFIFSLTDAANGLRGRIVIVVIDGQNIICRRRRRRTGRSQSHRHNFLRRGSDTIRVAVLPVLIHFVVVAKFFVGLHHVQFSRRDCVDVGGLIVIIIIIVVDVFLMIGVVEIVVVVFRCSD